MEKDKENQSLFDDLVLMLANKLCMSKEQLQVAEAFIREADHLENEHFRQIVILLLFKCMPHYVVVESLKEYKGDLN